MEQQANDGKAPFSQSKSREEMTEIIRTVESIREYALAELRKKHPGAQLCLRVFGIQSFEQKELKSIEFIHTDNYVYGYAISDSQGIVLVQSEDLVGTCFPHTTILVKK